MFEGFDKINGIIKVQKLGLPTPKTLFISDYVSQRVELNQFLSSRDFVMIRSERKGQSTHCPRNLKCSSKEALEFIKQLNREGFVAILQDHVPLNNHYSGNILLLNDSFIIEAMKGGPVSKLNREGVVDEHLRINTSGQVVSHYGVNVIPEEHVKQLINKVKSLPLKHHILEFSSGPNWFYFWHAREDKTSTKLESQERAPAVPPL